MKRLIKTLIIIPILFFITECSKFRDPAGVKSHCGADECHVSTPLNQYPPVTGKHKEHLARGYDCDNCHSGFLKNAYHKNGKIDGNLNRAAGSYDVKKIVYFSADFSAITWDASSAACGNITCHEGGAMAKMSPALKSSQSLGWYGNGSLSCIICHSPGTRIDPMTINGSGSEGKHAKHVTSLGINCEKCHYGYKGKDTHGDGKLDTDDKNGAITLFESYIGGSWAGDSGPGQGKCRDTACHGAFELDWYGPEIQGWTLPDCTAACHTAAIGQRRKVSGTGGDFDRESHHVINYGSRASLIVTNSDCLQCHEMTKHMGGTIRLKDRNNGNQGIVYNPLIPSSLEPFCLSCHDSDGAEGNKKPFSSPNTLGAGKNYMGDKINGAWTNTKTVHKDNGLTCAGSGAPGTGCHGSQGAINMHGSANKGLLTNNLALPVPVEAPTEPFIYDYNNYRLCFDCHESYPNVKKEVVLGYKKFESYDDIYELWYHTTPYDTGGMKSMFRDLYFYETSPPSYNSMYMGRPSFIPLHNYHLFPQKEMINIDLWYYRGNTGEAGRSSCTNCHNVHGANNTVRSTYQEFNITSNTSGTDVYNTMNGKTAIVSEPINCKRSCHGSLTFTFSYWNTISENIAIASTNPIPWWAPYECDISQSPNDCPYLAKVTIIFTQSTLAPLIDESNINSVLDLTGSNSWLDTNKGGYTGSLKAVWTSTNGLSNNVLTVNIYVTNLVPASPAGDPTIIAGDTITVDKSVIFGELGTMNLTILGSF